MAVASMSLGLRPQFRPGPALGRSPVPVASLVLSATVHVGVIAGVIAAALAWQASQPKIYVVNLVPTVAARGVEQGREEQAKPTRIEKPQPKPAPEPVEASVPKELPPPSTLPEMPARAARDVAPLPERVLPSRPPALPRPGEKELPTVASVPSPKPTPKPVPDVRAPAPPPRPQPAAPPVGKPTGTPEGAGALTLTVGDFPFTWYLQEVQRRITRSWMPPAASRDGQRAVIVFEIRRDGQADGIAVERGSGDPLYDLAALRAVTEASPFPRLPDEFAEPLLRVHLGFNIAGERG